MDWLIAVGYGWLAAGPLVRTVVNAAVAGSQRAGVATLQLDMQLGEKQLTWCSLTAPQWRLAGSWRGLA